VADELVAEADEDTGTDTDALDGCELAAGDDAAGALAESVAGG
jgi:hypothetical protein